MAAPIGKGDWVECIDAAPHARIVRPVSLVAGAIYQVSEVIAAGARPELGGGYSEDSVRLVGDPLPHPFAWRVQRFRPIYRPKREIIEALKAPPIRVRETEDA